MVGTAADLTVAVVFAFGSAAAWSRLLWPVLLISAYYAVGAVVFIVVTGLLFVVIPRVGQAALPMQPGGGRMVSGFTERVRLGAFGEIELDAAVVMRVHLTQFAGGRGAPEALPSLRWRGIAFESAAAEVVAV